MKHSIIKKLEILAESAKYDVSCSSSGINRAHKDGAISNTSSWGICHTYTEDGRCVSLLKILFTNVCIFDCAYCINRRSNDIERTSFTVKELAELTIEFYRRNYIEGLFLSSGVIKSADYTMERMVKVLKELRTTYRYNGYIHMKAIPGASQELVYEAGLYADRLSINIEIPSERSLKLLAPEKDHQSVYKPMHFIEQGMIENREERLKYKKAPRFVPAGQSTQIIVGASSENDRDILKLSSLLYQRQSMKRVYYSGFIPVNSYDNRLPVVKETPLVRENRLYQADWLMRFYQFDADEIVDGTSANLDLEIDPKLAWALRHPEKFPVDINCADYEQILRIPGVGIKSAKIIMTARKHGRLDFAQLKKIGIVLKRAQYFIKCPGSPLPSRYEINPVTLRQLLTAKTVVEPAQQLSLL